MERENDHSIDRMGDRVSALKTITIDIHGEVDSQHRLLDESANDFERARQSLRESARAFAQMVETARRQGYFWQVVGFVVFVVFAFRWIFL